MAKAKLDKKPDKVKKKAANHNVNEGDKKLDQFGRFLVKHYNKGELALKHAVGLGHVPNAVPVTKPRYKERPRPVEVGWHPVAGVAGKWFAEDTGLGRMITEKIRTYPDPTMHWAVLVGGFAHQLWMDENFDVIYTNERIEDQEWQTFPVGETRFNDDAIRRTGESVIQSIRATQPAYNLISNNCQTFTLQLLDAIKAGGNMEFGTTLAIYERLTGYGKVADLYAEPAPDIEPLPSPGRQDTVSFAQKLMNDKTNQLDTKEEMSKHEQRKKSVWSRLMKSSGK